MEHTYQSKDIEFPLQRIEDQDMEREVKSSFIEYSMSVITSRALPDVRDGMKPGQRRVLYAMYEDHLTYDKPFRKSATTVGNVLGRYHPHGDSAVYQTMVRMAQSFSLRCPLVEGHGNFGNVDGDGAAAYRYTEARMSRIADQMMRDIEKHVVPMSRNFDNTRDEPQVLPSRFPNLLVNGSVGIAVGMATNIPPHNLSEVIEGTIFRMENPECTVDDLMSIIHGPDFPTAAIIYGTRGIRDAYATGKGRIYVRAKAKIEDENRRIIFTEIPYMVNKAMLIESIANLVKEKKIEGISALRDESGRGGMRIVVEYRKDANGEIILNQLYKYTQLQDTCAVNMLVIDGGEPKILPLCALLDKYIAFQESIIVNRTKFDLDRALRELHILEGYKIASENIDEVIELIKRSASIPEAKAALSERFGLSEEQAQAIVDMTLGKLSGMERQKVMERIEKLREVTAQYRDILADENKIKDIVKTELQEIKAKFGDRDPRRTQIIEASEEIDIEDMIERHTCIITMSHTGYVKRQRADTYSAQGRGGKGLIGMTTKEEDFVENILVANSHSNILFFTNRGKVYMKKAYRIPEASRTAKGTNFVNIIDLEKDEKVTAVISLMAFRENEYLTMLTKRGVIKRTLLTAFAYHKKGGKIAIRLDEDDELLFVRHTKGEENIIITSREGMAVRFDENAVRCMGRTARGVRAMSLRADDEIVGMTSVTEDRSLLTVTENGLAKRTSFDEFRQMKNRGGFGVRVHKLGDKSGRLAAAISVQEDDDLMLITADGTVIRIAAADINHYSRTAAGVIVMRLSEGNRVLKVARIEKDEDIRQAEAQVEEEAANTPQDQILPEAEDTQTEEAEADDEALSAEDIADEELLTDGDIADEELLTDDAENETGERL